VVADQLRVGPTSGRDARTQRVEFRIGDDRDRERPDRHGAPAKVSFMPDI